MADEAGAPAAADGEFASSEIAALYGLSADDAALAEELCGEMLEGLGIDGRSFVERLRRTGRFDLALGVTPEIAEALYARAHRWFSVGYPLRAEPLFRALCIAYPGSADYWVGLGICLRIGGQPAAALTALEAAARLRPDWEVPRFHLAELSLLTDHLPEARRHLQAFEAHADEATPESMRREASRIEKALALRGRS